MTRIGLLATMILASPLAAASTEQPLRVTTDSGAYCAELANRFAGQPGERTEPARQLAEEGQRLCDTGHARTGIAKLRRALRITQAGG